MNALSQFSIRRRIALGFGLMIVLLIVAVGVAVAQFQSLRQLNHELLLLEREAASADAWRAQTLLNANRALAIAKSGHAERVVSHFDPLVKATSAEISELQKALEASADEPEDKRLMADIAEARKAYIDVRNEIFKVLKAGELEQGQAMVEARLQPAVKVYMERLTRFGEFHRRAVEGGLAKAQASTDRTLKGLAVLVLVCVGFGVMVAVQITRSVAAPLAVASEALSRIAGGDLGQPVQAHGRDEVGRMLDELERMRVAMHGMVTEIRQGTDGISLASREVASGGQDLSKRTEQTSANLQQAASSLEEITGTARSTSEAAAQGAQLARTAGEVASRGGAVVDDVVATMGEIDRSSKRIADIIGAIDGIAFQTNILALNAAVEAARAGEQGRGFAVVAGEVRSLAQRSAEAAREIKNLIGNSVERVDAGTRLVGQAGQTMREIMDSVQRVTDIIGEISHAANEQSAGIALVNRSVADLEAMTQQNAALVEESAAAAESLSDQADRVARSVSIFRV